MSHIIPCPILPWRPLYLSGKAPLGPIRPHVEEDQGDLTAVIRKGSSYGPPPNFSFSIPFIRFWNSNFILDVARRGYGCSTGFC